MKNRFYLSLIVFAISLRVLGLEAQTDIQSPEPGNCSYEPVNPDDDFVSHEHVYRISFLQDLPLRLTPNKYESGYSQTFTVYYQGGKLISGGTGGIIPSGRGTSEYLPYTPYCGITYYPAASMKTRDEVDHTRDFKLLESKVQAGTQIEFEHSNYFHGTWKDGRWIVSDLKWVNHSRKELFEYETRKKNSSDEWETYVPKVGDGVFTIACHSNAFLSDNNPNLTMQMVLSSFPAESIKIEKRHHESSDCQE
jgi:hypothetical protein